MMSAFLAMANKMFENDCFLDLEVGKLWLNFLFSINSTEILRPMYFFIKMRPLSMIRT